MLKLFNHWPFAKDPNLIYKTNEDYIEVSKGILELMIDIDLSNLNFWDYSNITSKISHEYGCFYDENKKFDVILLFDVIDHVQDPYKLIKIIKEKLSKKGHLFVRCHPWEARDADHNPNNKAYFHLLKKNNYLHHNKVDYKNLFNEFDIIYKREIRNYPEHFFEQGYGKKILFKKYGKLPNEIQNIDYKLKIKCNTLY